MPNTVFGLPTHALVVHGTVVLVPLAALLLTVAALWPRLRYSLGPLPALGGAVGLILVPITTMSGDNLKDRLGFESPAITKHADLGDGLLPWVAALFAAALLLLWADGWRPTAWATPRPSASGTRARPRALTLVVSLIVVALAVITVVQIIRIGHSGAEAVWQGVGSS
ncbi:hypothetical protein I6A84_12835 [Frankia sp. CNm7]|uniref:DUF2231 domain-containing protein n=1 Tax=Frankia nepalensis TaxID=1836974 RepID=A0A937RNW9_9ACTN|nr:DUF2231 domain-containing protein [Frankia nepalensis]MBL7497911.1 hypothetical protein [Frankia nepalensis]MBL7513811.1 hypothetical protein [Frankia nepalensis]MBL7518969.1 hypothetical protein [Frankia nepalensis]MBL7629933.1 hypothetical protein [Frankia nepalensis]